MDFTGDFDRIGFATNLVLGDGRSWTPASPVARGSTFEIAAVQRVGEESERALDVRPTADGALTVAPHSKGGWTVAGGDGRLFWDGETRDRVTVRFAEPVAVSLAPSGVAAGDFAFPVGVPCPVSVVFIDRTGAALGFHPDDVVLGVEGSLSFTDAGLLASGPGGFDVPVALGERAFVGPAVRAVALAEVDWEVVREPLDDTLDWLHLDARSGDLPVGCVALDVGWDDAETQVGPQGLAVPHDAALWVGDTLHAP